MEDRLGIPNSGSAEGGVVAGLGDGVKKLLNRLPVGFLPGLVVGDNRGPENAAALASPSMADVINVELVLSWVFLVPLDYRWSSPFCPVVDGLWSSDAEERLVARVLGDAVSGPALKTSGG